MLYYIYIHIYIYIYCVILYIYYGILYIYIVYYIYIYYVINMFCFQNNPFGAESVAHQPAHLFVHMRAFRGLPAVAVVGHVDDDLVFGRRPRALPLFVVAAARSVHHISVARSVHHISVAGLLQRVLVQERFPPHAHRQAHVVGHARHVQLRRDEQFRIAINGRHAGRHLG